MSEKIIGKVTEWTVGSEDADLDRLEIGDLLEFNGGKPYNHWAVFVGHDSIVHLINTNGDYFSRQGNGKIVLVKLIYYIESSSNKHTAEKSELKWRINNGYDGTLPPLQVEVIKKRARDQIVDNGEYCLITFNCEHFAHDCRYGRAYSRQVAIAARTIGASLAGSSILYGATYGGKTEVDAGNQNKTKKRKRED